MHSRELGLILLEQLFDMEDLHYGLWEKDLELSIFNAKIAQQRYNEMILSTLPSINNEGAEIHVLDIGCGTGNLMAQMLDKGYYVDGVSPSESLTKRIKRGLGNYPENKTNVFECKFQNFPDEQCKKQYDVAIFSESFQYIPMQYSFGKLQNLIKPEGSIIICDFFKTEAHGDGQKGDRSFGGGHRMSKFYAEIQDTPFTIQRDDDITSLVSPNIQLVNDLLMNKIYPASVTLDSYVKDNYSFIYFLRKLTFCLFKKKLRKIKYKYFSGYRSKEVFERYKTYRLMILKYK